MVQEELGNGQQCPGIRGIPTDPAVQDFQEGGSTAHVGGILFADNVHDCHCLNETLQESRELRLEWGKPKLPELEPHLCALTAFCRSPSSFFRGPAREMSPSHALSPHRNVRLSV